MPIRTVAGATVPTAEDEARAKTWARLPPEIQAQPQVRAKYLGLGDVVEVLAKPVARVLGLAGCASCAARKAWLNARAPNVLRRG